MGVVVLLLLVTVRLLVVLLLPGDLGGAGRSAGRGHCSGAQRGVLLRPVRGPEVYGTGDVARAGQLGKPENAKYVYFLTSFYFKVN